MKRLLLCLTLLPAVLTAQTLSSPDGNYQFSCCQVDAGIGYSITYRGDTIVLPSRLGISIDNRLFESALAVPRGNNDDWCSDLRLKSEQRSSVDTTWFPLYGEQARVRDQYNQLVLHYEKGEESSAASTENYDRRKFYAMDVVVRAYDEGIAFRYHFPETSNGLFLHVNGEQTTFRMPDGTLAWYEEWAQGPYECRKLTAEGPQGNWLESERPLLLQLPDGKYVALLEAAMKDFARGKFRLASENELQVALYSSADVITPYSTPWRVVMAGQRAVELINNKDLVLNLNLERETNGFSWDFVRPGKAFRSTRLDKASILRSIDYCAEFGIQYVELDAGWYGPEGKNESDARSVQETRDFTIPEICEYGRSRGVGVWLYVNQRALYRQLDDLLPLYRQWGVSGIKFGFVQVGNQQWSTWLHRAVEKCAEHGLMVDIHDEYRPSGLSRTLPNLLTQEGIRGNEEMPDATHDTVLPFTRFLCGAADYTLCYFNNRVKNTHAHQLALSAVYYSPLQFLFWYDGPFPTGWQGEELQFWRRCPTVFDESVALDGAPGQFIVQARRSGDEWFVGCLTNTEQRTLTVPTTFLAEKGSDAKGGRRRKSAYRVTVYNDDPSLDTPSKVAVSVMKIKAGQPITLQLQPSGGAALHFEPY